MLSFVHVCPRNILNHVCDRPFPVVSIAGIICQKYNVLCETTGFSSRFAKVYLESIDFASIRLEVRSVRLVFFNCFLKTISIALYGLLMFYGLTAEELKGRRPLAKFLAVKLIVMFTFYQSFVVSTHRSLLSFLVII